MFIVLSSYLFFMLTLASWLIARDLRHPAVLYGAIWTATLTLLGLNVMRYPDFEALTLVHLTLSALVFIIAAVIGSGLRRGKKAPARSPRPVHLPSVTLLASLTLLGVLSGLYYYQHKFGLAMLLHNPAQVRYMDRAGTGGFGLLLLLPQIAAQALLLRWLLTRQRPWLTFLTLLAALAYFGILPERSTVIGFVLWAAGMAAILDVRFSRRTLRYAGLAGAGLGIILAFFVAVSARTDKVDFVSSFRYAVAAQEVPDALIDPYVYLTASLPALNTLVTDPKLPLARLELERTIYPAARIWQILRPSAGGRLSEAEDPAYIPMYFNTFSWLSAPLRDLGLLGSYLYVAVVGLACGIVYRLARLRRGALWVYLYGGLFAATVLSVMTNRFSSLAWWVAAAFALVLFQVVGKLKLPARRVRVTGVTLPRVRLRVR